MSLHLSAVRLAETYHRARRDERVDDRPLIILRQAQDEGRSWAWAGTAGRMGAWRGRREALALVPYGAEARN